MGRDSGSLSHDTRSFAAGKPSPSMRVTFSRPTVVCADWPSLFTRGSSVPFAASPLPTVGRVLPRRSPSLRGQRPPTLSLRGQRPPTLVGNGPQLSLSSQATAPNSRGQRPQLSLAWAPAPSPAGVGPLPGGPCPISPQADRFDPSGGPSSLRLRAGRAQPRRGTAIPRARLSLCRSPLPVALRTARSQGWRARSPLPLASEAVWR